jgi:maltose/moltooligosaccharide transporter
MQKPRLSFWQIWNMSFGFFGIQFGWGLQMANMSAIYQYLGAKEADIAVLWLAAPLTGLIVQPIIGYLSDRTWGALGRRRPYFLAGAVLASLALVAMPNSGTVWMAAGLLWILDASVNITMEPFRAFVGDLLPAGQRKSGFAMQSLLIGLGAVLSSGLPYMLTNWFGVKNTGAGAIPRTVQLAFYIGSGIFFLAVLYTILTTREHPPEDLAAFRRMKAERPPLGAAARVLGILNTLFGIAGLGGLIALGALRFDLLNSPIATLSSCEALILIISGVGLLLRQEWARRLTIVYALLAVILRAVFLMLVSLVGAQTQVILLGVAQMVYLLVLVWFLSPSAREIGKGIGSMPRAMRQLAVVQFFTWFALFCMWIYFGPAVATKVFGGTPGSPEYQRGNEWCGVCFSVYNGTAFGFAFVLLALVRRFSARSIHRLCLLCGGGGLILTVVFPQQYLLIFSMLLVGVAWASILSMPYAMLSNAIPAQKMGFFMGVFNFFIVIPQILASLGLGSLMKSVLGGNPMNAVLLGGCSMIVAGLCVGLVSKEVDAAPQ